MTTRTRVTESVGTMGTRASTPRRTARLDQMSPEVTRRRTMERRQAAGAPGTPSFLAPEGAQLQKRPRSADGAFDHTHMRATLSSTR